MATRTLERAPSILPLYARAAAPLIPGAALLPFVPGRGNEVPDLELTLPEVRPDPDEVAAYARVCGFSLGNQLPSTYPHVLAFPLHMAVMADGGFPFGAVGLVHVENRIVQHRPIGLDEKLKLTVRPTQLQPHPRGQTFDLLTKAWSGPQKTWESTSTILRRTADGTQTGAGDPKSAHRPLHRPAAGAEWRLEGDLGRRYAGVSGDRNPIHMHALTAKPFGFPGAIAHGMWTKARCLAALQGRLPEAFEVDVRFRKPIRLPGRVEFSDSERGEDGAIEFAVRDAKHQTPHLDGRLRPIEAKRRSK